MRHLTQAPPDPCVGFSFPRTSAALWPTFVPSIGSAVGLRALPRLRHFQRPEDALLTEALCLFAIRAATKKNIFSCMLLVMSFLWAACKGITFLRSSGLQHPSSTPSCLPLKLFTCIFIAVIPYHPLAMAALPEANEAALLAAEAPEQEPPLALSDLGRCHTTCA